MISGPRQWAPPRPPAGLLPGSWRGLFTNIRVFFRALIEASAEQPKVRRFLVSYQHAFRMNASRRGEEVTQDKASGTARPTFKTLPLYDEVQIPPHLRE